jgi:hypothetical protein
VDDVSTLAKDIDELQKRLDSLKVQFGMKTDLSGCQVSYTTAQKVAYCVFHGRPAAECELLILKPVLMRLLGCCAGMERGEDACEDHLEAVRLAQHFIRIEEVKKDGG